MFEGVPVQTPGLPWVMNYLHYSKEEDAKERVLRALDRLGSDDNFQCVCSYLLAPSVQENDQRVRNMDAKNSELPVMQGVARGIDEFLTISRGARGELERQNAGGRRARPAQ